MNLSRYCETAVAAEVRRVQAAPEGARNAELNRAAFSLGGLVGAGALDRQEAQVALLRAAVGAGLGAAESEATIASGLVGGARRPRHLPENIQAAAGAAQPAPVPADDGPGLDLSSLAEGFYTAPEAAGKRAELAALLGVEVRVLEALRVGWRPSGEHTLAGWTWPERDAAGRVLGVQVRLPAGEERRFEQVKGGKIGLYYPDDLPERMDVLVVTEGGSDTCAALSLGLPAVGLHAAGAGVNLLVDLVRRVRPGRVLVVGDADPAGRASAEKVRHALEGAGVLVAVVFPPDEHKDLRGWHTRGGLTREHLLELAGRAAPAAPASGLAIVTADELERMTFQPPRWAIPDLVPEGLGVLAGPPKSGKSWLGLGWAVQVAQDGGEALACCLEDPLRRLQARLAALGAAPAGLHLATCLPRLDEGGAEALDAWLTAHPAARLVLLDTWARVKPGRLDRNADPYTQETSWAGQVQGIAHRHGVAILLVHHTRKSTPGGGGEADFVEGLIGTTGLAGAADAVLVLRRARGEAEGVLQVTGRDLEEREVGLRFDAGRWEILGDAREVACTAERRAVVQALRAGGGLPMSPGEVADATGQREANTRRLLARMTDDGQVLRGLRGRYRLPAEGDPLQERSQGSQDPKPAHDPRLPNESGSEFGIGQDPERSQDPKSAAHGIGWDPMGSEAIPSVPSAGQQDSRVWDLGIDGIGENELDEEVGP